ncbi:MAG: GAF domain-containing protein, partial [Chloroflexota bacterium]
MTPQPTGDRAALQAAAERALAAVDWEQAVALLARLIERARGDPPDLEAEYRWLSERELCYERLGKLTAQFADVEALADVAIRLSDPRRQVHAACRRAAVALNLGRLEEVNALLDDSLTTARALKDDHALAEALVSRGHAYGMFLGDPQEGSTCADEALGLYRALGDESGVMHSLIVLGVSLGRTLGRPPIEAALEIARRLGDREWEARCLNIMGIASRDHGIRRAYYVRAMAGFQAIDHRPYQAMMHNNLALTDWRLGLYARARDHASQAVQMTRDAGARYGTTGFLDALGRAYLGLGALDAAEQAFQEALGLVREMGFHADEFAFWGGLGLVALARGDVHRALEYLARTSSTLNAADSFETSIMLAFAGAAHLAQGETDPALQATADAAALVEAVKVSSEFNPQDVWWWRHCALAAKVASLPAPDPRLAEEAWRALDRARQVMLDDIEALHDEGLRRNYFNKVVTNREIVQAWLRAASGRGLSPTPLTDHLAGGGDVQGQLERLLDIGVRLNARAESPELPQDILDEVVELIGAERVLLVLFDEQGVGHDYAFGAPPLDQAQVAPFLDGARRRRAPLLRYAPEGAPALEQLSVLAVPMAVGSILIGLIYAEMDGCYGRFTDQDRDLLAVLANQAAVAVRNGDWARTLEHRVTERTVELQAANQRLEQRTAELEIVNRIQQGLAQQLDFQAIIDLVGDEVRRIFRGESTFIAQYNQATEMIHFTYWVGPGEARTPTHSMPLGQGLTSLVIRSRQPLVCNTFREMADLGVVVVQDGIEQVPESWLGVPILVGDTVTGVVAVQDWPQNRYGESDVRLLTTLAN